MTVSVSCVLDGHILDKFDGVRLTICVPNMSTWRDYTVLYAGDTYTSTTQITSSAHGEADQASFKMADPNILPVSLCLCTSEDDADSYHVSIRDFTGSRVCYTQTIGTKFTSHVNVQAAYATSSFDTTESFRLLWLLPIQSTIYWFGNDCSTCPCHQR